MKTKQKPHRFKLCLMGLVLAAGLTFHTSELNAQTQEPTTDDCPAKAAQDQKIQQLQDKLEEIQQELIELKQGQLSRSQRPITSRRPKPLLHRHSFQRRRSRR